MEPRTDPTGAMERLLARFIEWGHAADDVRAIAVIGSRARTDRPADRWSDLDLVVVTRDPDDLLQRSEWLDAIAPYVLTFLEPTATGNAVERRVLFEGGEDVDVVPVAPGSLAEMLADPSVADVIRRGVRVVLDKEGEWSDGLPTPSDGDRPLVVAPTEDELLALVSDGLYHWLWAARKLARGELFIAKQCCDVYLKALLLTLIGWHARLVAGRGDTWFGGRFLEQWAPPHVLDGLRGSYARYDEADVRRALAETMRLFTTLARETSGVLGYRYPDREERRVAMLVTGTRAERSA